jgi:hypothetical protein
MKRCIVSLLLIGFGFGFAARPLAQPTAQVTLSCYSLRFHPATSGTQTLQFTSDPNGGEMNGEVFPLGDPSLPDYGTTFVFEDPSTASSISGQMAFNVPSADANGDGFDDFLQLDQAAGPDTTPGAFSTQVDKGQVSATWSRAAGSSTGTCRIQWQGQTYGRLPDFTFTFELLTYQGKMRYSPGATSIVAFLTVTNAVSSSNVLSGPLAFVRSATNQLNQLSLLPGALVNSAGQSMPFDTPDDILRDEKLKTNYYGSLVFQDGDLTTSTADYQAYILSIDDPNDSNGNGIPDLTDNPGPVTDVQPTLGLTQSANQLLLSVHAAVGSSFNLEEIAALDQTNWLKSTTITLTNNPQVLPLPLPASPVRFWRLRGL